MSSIMRFETHLLLPSQQPRCPPSPSRSFIPFSWTRNRLHFSITSYLRYCFRSSWPSDAGRLLPVGPRSPSIPSPHFSSLVFTRLSGTIPISPLTKSFGRRSLFHPTTYNHPAASRLRRPFGFLFYRSALPATLMLGAHLI